MATPKLSLEFDPEKIPAATTAAPLLTPLRDVKPTLAAKILRTFCRPVDSKDYPGGTAKATIDTALDFTVKTVPGFFNLIREKSILDFGCGFGLQAAALAMWGFEVTGLDLPRPTFQETWGRLQMAYPVTLTTAVPDRQFDVVYSCSSFEHFSAPEAILRKMAELTKPGGRIVITFAEPWYSNNGSHMGGFCRLPWVNLLFSEQTIMAVRSLYRTDGATRYADVEGGLNQMTVARFERIIQGSGLIVESMNLHATWGLPLVTRIPVLRELLTSACSAVLRKP